MPAMPVLPRRVSLSFHLVVFMSTVFHTLPSRADEADALNLFATHFVQRDSNLFRLADGARPPFGTGERDDTVNVSSAGVRFDRTYSLQRLRAELVLTRSRYEEYDFLDHETTSGVAGWDWAVGNRWSGTVETSQREALRGFADFVFGTTPERSINRLRRTEASANYWWHSNWSSGLGAIRVSSRFSDSRSSPSEYDEDITEARMTYRPRSGNRLALVLRRVDGEYPNRNPELSGSNYEQQDMRLDADWRVTGHSRLYGYVGYTQREYPDMSSRDFSGVTGRLVWDWTPTGKLSLNVVARREIGAHTDLVDNFVVTRALAISPAWAPTAKTLLRGRVEWRRRDYGGDPGLGFVRNIGRDDRTRIVGLVATWEPLRNLLWSISLQREERESDNPLGEYEATTVGTNLSYEF